MKKKRLVWLLAALLASNASIAAAQQADKIPKIGILQGGSTATSPENINAFRKGLRELGYVDGKNILLEYRYATGKPERLAELASELVNLKVDVIVSAGTQTTTAAKQATSTIPIVAGAAGDLVRTGLVASLARPGGNVTGSTVISPDVSGKRVEILKEVVPKATRIAVLLYSGSVTDREEAKQTEAAAQTLKIKVQIVEVTDPGDFQGAYTTIKRDHVDALILAQSSFTNFHRKELISLGVKNRLATMCESTRWTEAGCVTSYGPDLPYQYYRAAFLIDKILKGAKPADLPVEQPTKFELVINLKTAKEIGLTIPPNVLARADKVIR
ncbi:MAG TPA: ABC transporter substrate-binding protein [Candidatus Binatia bacterium]|nr:ABC transporter substrate-binding protein [Candidatus Binatia bacterium]